MTAHFRDSLKRATKQKPLMLEDVGAKALWWTPYYKKGEIKSRDRLLFAGS